MDIIHYFFEAKRISGEDCVRKVKKKKSDDEIFVC